MTPAFERLRQEDGHFEASLGYVSSRMMRPCLKMGEKCIYPQSINSLKVGKTNTGQIVVSER